VPGSNHNVDASFMDALPISVREAGLDLIRFYSLEQMIELKMEGINQFLKERFQLNEEQWTSVLNAVILTKVSYFEIQLHFPIRYIDKLIEIAAYARGLETPNPVDLYQSMLSDHPQFADWIKKAIQVKQQNIRFQNNLAVSS